MNEVRLSSPGDIRQLKALWKACFGDSDRYIDFFYNNRYKPEESVVLLEGNAIATMLVLLPMSIRFSEGQSFSAGYLYAFATHLKFRGRGYGPNILQFVDTHLIKLGVDSTITVPATGMFDYFAKVGFIECFYIREAMIDSQAVPLSETEGKIQVSAPDTYNAVRNEFLKGSLHVRYDNEAIDYQKKLSMQAGADIYHLHIGDVTGCAAAEVSDTGVVFIKELLLPDKYLTTGLSLLAGLLPAKQYIVRTPAFIGAVLGGEVRPYGMIKYYKTPKMKVPGNRLGYLAFAYD
ncbi:MAG: GCN5-related N-acetyltransferase [Firmicutes bacterium]|nr:GCN5-related N-acetyltransferase [Bacillota bacterium]